MFTELVDGMNYMVYAACVIVVLFMAIMFYGDMRDEDR